jgi:hypothetical protein
MTTSNYSQMEDLDWDVLGKCGQIDLSQLEGCRTEIWAGILSNRFQRFELAEGILVGEAEDGGLNGDVMRWEHLTVENFGLALRSSPLTLLQLELARADVASKLH